MEKQKKSVPYERHPVKDPSMTTSSFFHENKLTSGHLSLRNHHNKITTNILKRKLSEAGETKKQDENKETAFTPDNIRFNK